MADADRQANIAKGCLSTAAILFWVAVAVFGYLVSPGNERDDGRSRESVRWETYDVEIDVRDDGTLRVTERQEVRFDGTFRRGYAVIPLERIESISNVQVMTEGAPADANGDGFLSRDEAAAEGEMIPATHVDGRARDLRPNQFTVDVTESEVLIDYGFESTGNGYYSIYPQVRSIILEYDVEGAIRDYPDAEEPWQQVHWMAISGEVTDIAPIDDATVTITLPEPVPVETLAYAPEPDSVEGDELTWSRSNLSEGDSVDVQVAFPAITAATAPSWQAAADEADARVEEARNRRSLASLMLIGAGILTAVAGGLGFLYAWYTRIREVVPGLVPDRLPEPPDSLPAGLVGALVDEEVHPRDIAAAIVDMDRRGLVEIREATEPTSGTFGQQDRYSLALVGRIVDAEPYEQTILETVFGANAKPGTVVGFSALRSLFGSHRDTIQHAFERELVRRGFLAEMPGESRNRWMTVLKGVVGLTGIIAVGILVWTRSWTWWAILPPLVGALVYVVGKRLTPRIARKTPSGAEASARWLAFQRHLESTRFSYFGRHAKGIDEKYLPWVVAFGLDHHWVSQMNTPVVAPAGTRPPASASTPSPGRGWRRVDDPSPAGGSFPGRRWSAGGTSWGGWDAGSWPDMQGSSDSMLSKLSAGSNSLFSMMGDAMAAMGESSGSGGSGGYRGGGSRGSSRSGGGRSSSSSGGGSRGFR